MLFGEGGAIGVIEHLQYVGANPLVNWHLTLSFRQTNQCVENKNIYVVQIKPKAIKSFENVVTSGKIVPTNTSSNFV